MCIYIFDYKNIFEYKNIFYRGMRWAWVNQHSVHLHIVTLSKMLHLGWWLPYIENTSWIAYNLFNGNYRSPSFAFQHQHFSQFWDVHYLVTTVKFFKTISSSNKIHQDGVEANYVFIPMYCDFLQVEYCLLKSPKWFELISFNVGITTAGRLGLKWLPVSWKVGKMQIFAFSNCSLGRGVAAYTYF